MLLWPALLQSLHPPPGCVYGFLLEMRDRNIFIFLEHPAYINTIKFFFTKNNVIITSIFKLLYIITLCVMYWIHYLCFKLAYKMKILIKKIIIKKKSTEWVVWLESWGSVSFSCFNATIVNQKTANQAGLGRLFTNLASQLVRRRTCPAALATSF